MIPCLSRPRWWFQRSPSAVVEFQLKPCATRLASSQTRKAFQNISITWTHKDFFSPPVRWGLFDFMSALSSFSSSFSSFSFAYSSLSSCCQPSSANRHVQCQPSTASRHVQCSLPGLNREPLRPPELRPAVPSVPCRTSVPSVPCRTSVPSVPCRTSTSEHMSERMSEDMWSERMSEDMPADMPERRLEMLADVWERLVEWMSERMSDVRKHVTFVFSCVRLVSYVSTG